MTGFILGKKVDMKRVFTEEGEQIPVTSISTTPNYLIDIKTTPGGTIHSVKLGFWITKKIKKSREGELKKAGITTPLRFLREIRLDKKLKKDPEAFSLVEKDGKRGLKIGETEIYIGQELSPTLLFKKGDIVMVSGVSKGKGFAGVVKRHGFAGGPRTHGQSDRERAPGSIGASTTPGRVLKGKRMAGRMGSDRVSLKNVIVVESLDTELIVKGPVPGARGGLLIIS